MQLLGEELAAQDHAVEAFQELEWAAEEMGILGENMLPVGRHLNVDRILALDWSLEEGADEIDLLDSTSESSGLGKEHADRAKRGGGRPGVFHDGLALEITAHNNPTLELVESAVRLNLATEGFHKWSCGMVDDFGRVDNGKVEDLGVN